MAKKSAKSAKKNHETESVDEAIAADEGTTLDDDGEWQGAPEEGAEAETEEHKYARRVLGR